MKKPIMYFIFGSVFGVVFTAVFLHIYLLDGLDGLFFSDSFAEDTIYADGYSGAAFRKIKKGMTKQEVISILDYPLGQVWYYDSPYEQVIFDGQGQKVKKVHSHSKEGVLTKVKEIKEGMSDEEVLQIMGPPTKEGLFYSKTQKDKSYRERAVVLINNKVNDIIHRFYVD